MIANLSGRAGFLPSWTSRTSPSAKPVGSTSGEDEYWARPSG